MISSARLKTVPPSSTNSHRVRSPCTLLNVAAKSSSDNSPLRFRLHNADMTSTGVIAEDNKSCRRNKDTTRPEPFSLTYRFIKALVSK